MIGWRTLATTVIHVRIAANASVVTSAGTSLILTVAIRAETVDSAKIAAIVIT